MSEVIPQYFYSTTSQSAAAILAIVSGFIINYLGKHLNEIRPRFKEVEEKVKGYIGQNNNLYKSMKEAIDEAKKIIELDKRKIENNQGPNDTYHRVFEFPQFKSIQTGRCVPLKQHIEENEGVVNKLTHALEIFEYIEGPYDTKRIEEYTKKLDKYVKEFPDTPTSENERIMKSEILSKIQSLRSLTPEVQKLRDKLIPQKVFWIFLIGVFALAIGVVAPLIFLQVDKAQIIVWVCLIGALIIGCLSIILFLGSQLLELHQFHDISTN